MSARYALVSDSTADLPVAFIRQHQIYIAPLHVLWGQETLRDGVDISSEEFFARLQRETVLPTTSQPTPAEFAALYERAMEETGAEGILVLTISADLSGTYSSAIQAAKEASFPVRVVDTRTASAAEGLVVAKMAELRDAGMALDEAAELAQSLTGRTRLIFTLDTLEYLHKGGRIGTAQRLIGTALAIKPVLHVPDGTIHPRESVRTRKRAVTRLVEIFEEVADLDKPMFFASLNSEAEDESAALEAAILERWQPQIETHLNMKVGCTIGVHVGPGAIGYAVLQ
ncbi:MAG: DegV family protein [Anaerolineae bacterium]|nr:DegV family protein [Anaerolineae bacterium]